MSGGDSEEDTPVPMPNTAVKLFCANGSWGLPPARVGRCQADKATWSSKKSTVDLQPKWFFEN